MASLPQVRYTPEQYLELDRKADHRSEYVNGEVLAMAGASRVHNRITLNIGAALTEQLRGSTCEPFTSDLRVKSLATGSFLFPDVVVGCGPLEFEDSSLDILLNPTVIMEVLSPTTAADDRSWKFAHYRRLETLTDYVMLSQFEPFVEHYTRRGDHWVLTELIGLEAVLHLPSLGCELPLTAVYERVEFAPDPEMPALEVWQTQTEEKAK